jgi:hypothetical protein
MENKTRTKPKISELVNAQIDYYAGATEKEIKSKYGISKSRLASTTTKINEILASDSDSTSFERKIISEALSDKLRPIKEEISLKSLEIIRKTDEEVSKRLDSPEGEEMKDLVKVSDIYSRRLARITGMEEDPSAGEVDPLARAKTVNVFINNVFQKHKENLEKKRNSINSLGIVEEVEA